MTKASTDRKRLFPSLSSKLRPLVAPKAPEPSYPRLPQVDDKGQSTVSGIYLVGELAGTPLIKLGLNAGVEKMDQLHETLPPTSSEDPELLDVLIVGAGSSGLGAAMRAHELGRRALVLESNLIAQTIVTMYKGKLLFAEPLNIENKSSMWFEECTREQLLEKWKSQIDEVGLDIHEHEKVVNIVRSGSHFEIESNRHTYRARKVILAMGKAGNPRKAGVAGEQENPGKILHSISDPGLYRDQDILIYGGGDVAAEAALALCDDNRVTLVTIDKELIYPKKRNRDALLQKQKEGRLGLHLSSRLVRIDADKVSFQDGNREEKTLDNDLVLEMIGAELPLKFFEKVGIKLEGTWDFRRWAYLAAAFAFVYSLYALKKFPERPYSWPFYLFFSEESFNASLQRIFEFSFLPFRWLFQDQAYRDILDTSWFQQGYLYSLLYTVVMAVFGWQAFVRWKAYASNPRYQKWRYTSLIGFQVVFFLVANVIALQAMSVQNSWRAWGLYQPWPLFFNTFHWWDRSDPRVILYLFAGAGILGTAVVIPWLSHRHGKRFCTWVCGCGGLAETLGDRWRHLSPKGRRSRSWEFQGVVVLLAAFIVTFVTVAAFKTQADNLWAKSYAYIVDFWLVAVIPIALYPFFGGKVWCRYWCPLAALNGLLAKWYGKLQIGSNDKCISCTQCSKYCQVGVDVMAFAKNQAPFDNANSACIQCGICVDVCPMDVLSFEQKDRVPGPAPVES